MNHKEVVLTQARVKELLNYDQTSGYFTWLPRTNKAFRHAGLIAGCKDNNGYICIKIDGYMYLAHRLVFLYMEGYWPVGHVDHRDHNPENNKWSNLRKGDRSFNMENKISASKCKKHSKYLGVHWNGSKFTAKITIKGVRYYLGVFDNEISAYEAYLAKKRQYHEGNIL